MKLFFKLHSDVFTRLFEEQAQLMRSIADASGVSNSESRVKLVKLRAFWRAIGGMETLLGNIPIDDSYQWTYSKHTKVSIFSHFGNVAKVVESIELTARNYEVSKYKEGIVEKTIWWSPSYQEEAHECLYDVEDRQEGGQRNSKLGGLRAETFMNSKIHEPADWLVGVDCTHNQSEIR